MLTWLFTKTPLLFFVQSFWRDEAFSYLLARKGLFSILLLTGKDFNPPFYYLILHFWIKCFGGSEIALRSLSFIFYWATVYTVFLFFQKIFKFSFKKSLVYLVLVLINPLLVYYAFEARMYTMFAFLASLSFYAFYKKNSFLYLASSIVGLYTHYFMIFVILTQFVFILLTKKKKKIAFLKNIFFTIFAFLPWLIFVLTIKPVLNQSFWITKPKLFYLTNLLGSVYFGHEIPWYAPKVNILNIIVAVVSVLLMVFGLIALWWLKKQKIKKADRHLIQYLLLWSLAIPLLIELISLINPIYLPRYFIFSTIGFLLLIIFLLDKLPRRISIFFLLVLFLLTYLYQVNQLPARSKTNLRKTLAEIQFLAKKNDRLYVANELDFLTAQYYFPENRVYIFGKSYREIPDYIGKVLISSDRIINVLPTYPNKAFILNSNGSYEVKAIY